MKLVVKKVCNLSFTTNEIKKNTSEKVDEVCDRATWNMEAFKRHNNQYRI